MWTAFVQIRYGANFSVNSMHRDNVIRLNLSDYHWDSLYRWEEEGGKVGSYVCLLPSFAEGREDGSRELSLSVCLKWLVPTSRMRKSSRGGSENVSGLF